MLRDWKNVHYLPILSLRPAEMRALEELPNKTKDYLLPVIHLRQWLSSCYLDSSITRITEVYGDRPVVIAMGKPEDPKGRPVYSELEILRNPFNGFYNWLELIRSKTNFIPSIQFSLLTLEEERQILEFYKLTRGMVIIIEEFMFPQLEIIAERVGRLTESGKNVCFILDFGDNCRDCLQVAGRANGYIKAIRQYAPYSFASVSASSFPSDFAGRIEQDIYERLLFDSLPTKDRIIYSDRGSARVEKLKGGGGQPYPRIDYPLRKIFKFYRSDEPSGLPGYVEQANILIRDNVWNSDLRVWGTQMIERTAAGDASAINTPQKATAARINIHLQLQSFYNHPDAAEDTDEDWQG